MTNIIEDFLPHAPQLGLYVAPNIPPDKLRNAIADYARAVPEQRVLALYDATLMGSGKDGAVFLADRFICQNMMEPAQEIRYADIVRIDTKRPLLGGRQLIMDVNRGRATVTHKLDFSGRPEAAEYVARFLHEVMLHAGHLEARETVAAATDVEAVRAALDGLRAQGLLADGDYRRLMAVLESGG